MQVAQVSSAQLATLARIAAGSPPKPEGAVDSAPPGAELTMHDYRCAQLCWIGPGTTHPDWWCQLPGPEISQIPSACIPPWSCVEQAGPRQTDAHCSASRMQSGFD